jgi:hypothetical protein
MRVSHLFRTGSAIALAGLVACAEQPTPTDVDARKMDGVESAKAPARTDEVVKVSPLLGRINDRLARAGANLRVDRAEGVYAAKGYDAQSPTLIFANNRTHQLAYQWVPGDPRRDGRRGVNYALDPQLQVFAGSFALPALETGAAFRPSTAQELETYIEEAMQAWRDRKCSDSPIDRVAVPTGTDPDMLDQVLLGNPVNSNYQQPSDIVQTGWHPPALFEAITPGGAAGILGVAFTFVFADDQGTADPSDDVDTDINGDGKLDTGLVEIYYNPYYVWTNRGAPGGIDFYSILTHETGHALGLAHFGKVFITKHDAADGIQISDVKYAPQALMNAVYVDGRGEIVGADQSSFCQIWASK